MAREDLTIPGYEILGELARGGMAVVYLAKQLVFDREVALKVMAPELARDQNFGKRFLREAKLVAGLSHTNIVHVYDTGKVDGTFYLAMEYLKGGDLRNPKLQEIGMPDILHISLCVLDALEYAAKNAITHRDVKPANIMFRADGTVVLVDFGIAKSAEAEDTNLTQTGVRAGTPAYMSPEQFDGFQADSRSDVYSFGIVLYEMLSGTPPFHARGAAALGIAHRSEPIPPLPKPLRKLQPVLEKALAKEPADRYQSTAEFSASLLRLKDAIPITGPENVIQGSSTTAILSAQSSGVSSDARATLRHSLRLRGTSKRAASIAVLVFTFLCAITGYVFYDPTIPKFLWSQTNTEAGDSASPAKPIPSDTNAAVAVSQKEVRGDSSKKAMETDVVTSRLSRAQLAYDNSDHGLAIALAKETLSFVDDDPTSMQLKDVKAKAQKIAESSSQILALNSRLENQVSDGHLYAPPGNNAYATIQRLTEYPVDPNTFNAKIEMLDRLVEAELRALIQAGKLDTAHRELALAEPHILSGTLKTVTKEMQAATRAQNLEEEIRRSLEKADQLVSLAMDVEEVALAIEIYQSVLSRAPDHKGAVSGLTEAVFWLHRTGDEALVRWDIKLAAAALAVLESTASALPLAAPLVARQKDEYLTAVRILASSEQDLREANDDLTELSSMLGRRKSVSRSTSSRGRSVILESFSRVEQAPPPQRKSALADTVLSKASRSFRELVERSKDADSLEASELLLQDLAKMPFVGNREAQTLSAIEEFLENARARNTRAISTF